MEITNLNAVLLIKSKKQQEGGDINNAQINSLKVSAVKKGLKVLKTFQVLGSSTNAYKAAIDYLKKQERGIALITDAIVGVQSPVSQLHELYQLYQSDKIKIYFVEKGVILDKDSKNCDLLMWKFIVTATKNYISARTAPSTHLKELMLKNGYWIGSAPIGYLNVKGSATTKASIILDKSRASLVKECFESYATGNFPISAIVLYMDLTSPISGKPLSAEQIESLLRNPFYCGIMKVDGIAYRHKYPQIIDEALYLRCQQQLSRFVGLKAI